ncbi:MAG: Rrf2 family transcriptional regulator [Clostridia bacterium]|nr:Rrf2 family transcriptional regulator [Clostridia bacterium]
MNISTRGRYGLRAVLDLAVNYSERPVTLSAIAARQQLSEGYLEQLMVPMKKAGIIASTRGAQGGYYLAREPQDILVGDVFRALEGPLALVACISEEKTERCQRKDICGSAFIWSEIQTAISDVLNKYTVADLIDREYQLDACKELKK